MGDELGFVEYARLYSQLGWALVPLDGKAPHFRNWPNTTPDAPELAAGKWNAWGEKYNMGVVLGPSGLAVLEDDSDDGRAWLLQLFGGRLPQVPTVESGGRSLHLYFHDGGYKPAARGGLELRCGAQQVVVPPSVHPVSGRAYRWLIPPWAAT